MKDDVVDNGKVSKMVNSPYDIRESTKITMADADNIAKINEKEITDYPKYSTKYEFMMEYFKSLREEILLSQKSRFQIAIWKFGAITFLLGIYFGKEVNSQASASLALLPRFIPLICIMFDLMYFAEIRRGIFQIGAFIRDVIEKEWFSELYPQPKEIKLWEIYLNESKGSGHKLVHGITVLRILLLLSLFTIIFGIIITGDYAIFAQFLNSRMLVINGWEIYWFGLSIFYLLVVLVLYPYTIDRTPM